MIKKVMEASRSQVKGWGIQKGVGVTIFQVFKTILIVL